jgi:hypothetical protein
MVLALQLLDLDHQQRLLDLQQLVVVQQQPERIKW